ncbi:aldo-keto reductase-6 [Coleophoma cylindrospora]|uniref:Aldo-keto reductase-6 n=1 Tax=Coleophoma cylindrospora TaxID=1849047 RepID=A0A3D8QX85_9HELO|nr:aldo-keto reductase-6 [Coleophoma cylindrospora]
MKLPITLSLLSLSFAFAFAYEKQQPILPDTLAPKSTISQPLIGFGTWNLDLSSANTSAAVSYAIQAGYRQIDAAAIYRNEKEVGEGIQDGLEKAGLDREEIWVTSKLWNDHHGDPTSAEAALNKTLEDLGLEYLDLYLMHWPVGSDSTSEHRYFDYVETWKSMIALPKSKVLNIGIANFSPAQLSDLISSTGVKPAVHQMELHPYLQQSAWVATHKTLGIAVTAYSPLAHSTPTTHGTENSAESVDVDKDSEGKREIPPLLRNPVMLEIAAARNCTPAQVALAWGMGRGTSVIPKSSHPERILENLQAGENCKLGHGELTRMRIMGRMNLRRFINPSESWGIQLFEELDDA